jgi:two-component system phosphate regulon sensor histidine kinase PhoR
MFHLNRKIAFLLALFMTVACLLTITLLYIFTDLNIDWSALFLVPLPVFIFTFLLSLLLNRIFVFSHLAEIYRQIVHHRNHKETRSLAEPPDDVIHLLKDEVEGWAQDRKNETERLKKLEQYRKEYIGNVSHELKTPVFNIQGYILTLLDGGLDDQEVNVKYLQRTEESVERMINIISDLESISQLETGELVLEPERFDVVDLIKDICDTQEVNATTKGIILSLANYDPVFVYADRFRIRQVLTNLIVNSIKYGKEYGETILSAYEEGDHVTVIISDNGIGITSEHLPRLFERFYRVDKSRSRDIGGTGLGLAIVKHIVEAHGSEIKVSSQHGAGSTFTFSLQKG